MLFAPKGLRFNARRTDDARAHQTNKEARARVCEDDDCNPSSLRCSADENFCVPFTIITPPIHTSPSSVRLYLNVLAYSNQEIRVFRVGHTTGRNDVVVPKKKRCVFLPSIVSVRAKKVAGTHTHACVRALNMAIRMMNEF